MEEKVVPINKNKEPEIDSTGFLIKQLESFPKLERAILQLSLGLGEPFEILHTIDEIAEILNESKEIIEKNWKTGTTNKHIKTEQKKHTQALFFVRVRNFFSLRMLSMPCGIPSSPWLACPKFWELQAALLISEWAQI